MEVSQKIKRTHVGEVVSDKMNKTITVEVVHTFKHPRIHKIMRRTKKYKVHDEQNSAKIGDQVEFYEGRPISKTKYMYLTRIVKSQLA
ncbi:MAG TPA: 30S ribosomal protein S17 [Candidatus Dependentiae bacterium]|nr:30S ribosomal protein S17 [Candidatus Dependentiae bacterium]HRQ62307.1 30S ribosomal protein S17 [Candidatus Dependentiae bacterium]